MRRALQNTRVLERVLQDRLLGGGEHEPDVRNVVRLRDTGGCVREGKTGFKMQYKMKEVIAERLSDRSSARP